jgi:epoxyqueuosine reductase
MAMQLLEDARASATMSGLNLFGIVDAERFDACQPAERRARRLRADCGTIVVVGSGGRSFWQAYAQNLAGGTADAHARQTVRSLVGALQQAGHVCRAIDVARSACLHAARLGEAAGFGTVSPVSGLLLHPTYGPWLQVRAAILIAGRPFGAIADAAVNESFQPCCNCSRPCVAACPASVHDDRGQADLVRCGSHRTAGGCTDICATRAACPVGSEHRDAPGEAAHRHSFDLAAMQRWFGFGVWRWLPRALRTWH